jgi:copper chaperone
MSTESTVYRVQGMTCGGCVKSLTRAVERAAPGVTFEVRLEPGELEVRGPHDPKVIARAVDDAGFDLAA